MNRIEIAGWLQLIVALVALYFTATNSGPALDAIAQLGVSGELPEGFAGSQGVIRVFLFVLLLVTLIASFSMGSGIVLGALFRHLGALSPLHASFSFVAALLLGSLALTLGMLGHLIWIPTAFLTILAVLLSGIAAIDDGKEGNYWGMAILGGGAAIIGGTILIAFASIPAGGATPDQPASEGASEAPPLATNPAVASKEPR